MRTGMAAKPYPPQAPSELPIELPARDTLLRALRTGAPEIPALASTSSAGMQESALKSVRQLLEEYPEWPSAGHARQLGEVPRVSAASFSYDAFFRNHLLLNEPVVIEGVTTTWRATKEWVQVACNTQGENRADQQVTCVPNVDELRTRFGESRVLVADCAQIEGAKRRTMRLSDYVDYWNAHQAWRDGADEGLLDSKERMLEVLEDPPRSEDILYLKDWHQAAEFPDYEAYVTPKYFADDWLNWHHDCARSLHDDVDNSAQCADYRFVYLGPKGSFTALHSDVLRSNSWSVNLCGSKQWLLWPPEETAKLLDVHGNHMPQDVMALAAQDYTTEYPHLEGVFRLEVIQRPGEAIFVPSGWHHQVRNLEDTLSINHNWFNACSLHWVYQLLRRDLADATSAIEDCRGIADDFDALCQRNLKINSSMDFQDFFHFLQRIACGELVALEHPTTPESVHLHSQQLPNPDEEDASQEADGLTRRQLQAAFNLQRVLAVLRSLADERVFQMGGRASATAEGRLAGTGGDVDVAKKAEETNDTPAKLAVHIAKQLDSCLGDISRCSRQTP